MLQSEGGGDPSAAAALVRDLARILVGGEPVQSLERRRKGERGERREEEQGE